MTLQASGQISLGQVNTELGLAATTTISLNAANVRSLASVASGQISMSSLYGKSAGPGNYTFAIMAGTSAPYTSSYVTALPTTALVSGVTVATDMTSDSTLQVGTVEGNFTITAWVNLTTVAGNSVILDAPYSDHSPPYYSYHLRLSNGYVFFGYNNAGNYATLEVNGTTVTANQWAHVAVVYSSAGFYIRGFINGIQQSSTALNNGMIQYFPAPLTVGYAPNWGGLLQGKVGMVRLYRDKGFTNAEILADYQVGFTG